VDRAHGFSGPRPGLWVHGVPQVAVAKGLAAARTRGRSGDWKLADGGGNGKGSLGVPTVGEGGRCSAGGRPATVDRNGCGLELGVG
jgi:hypothetical protein